MTSEEAVQAVIEALDATGIGYMLVGAFSVSRYGIARSTKDADFVVELGDRSIGDLLRRLGSGFDLDPQMRFERATGTTRQIISVPDVPFIVELFQLSKDDHDQERFRRRRASRLFGLEVWLPSAEDVVVTKLRWALNAGRSKDRDDVRGVLAVQGDALDFPYIRSWTDRHGTSALLDEILASIPPI